MPTYILLSSLTPQGVQTLKSNPDRLREVNRDVEELGAKVLHQWATLGEYDFVNVVDAPDAATIARVSVALGARGSTKIQTLPALPIDEFLRSIEEETGVKPEWAVEAFTDLEADVRRSIERIKASPFIPRKDGIRGFVYEVETGRLREVSEVGS